MLTLVPSTHSKIVVVLAALLFATACPSGSNHSPPPTQCVKSYEQCKLPSGPLGVCHEAPCAQGETPPCLKCISQH